jgi:hypothetical protein
MAFGKSLENNKRKHGNNLGYLTAKGKEKAIKRLNRAMARATKLGIDEKEAHKSIARHILMNAHIAFNS